MYPADWHRTYSDTTGHSARLILPPLLRLFGVRSLVEVGCGHAHWTQAAVDAGVEDYTVVDGPWTELDQLQLPALGLLLRARPDFDVAEGDAPRNDHRFEVRVVADDEGDLGP